MHFRNGADTLAPLVAIVYVLFMLATAALGTPMGLAELGLADLAVGGKAGFVVWSALLGAGAGRIIAVWRTKRHKRRGKQQMRAVAHERFR